ncbi:MAG: hypothetical protein IPP66_04930 [Anaerolineales bacterium]|nr:hypothetical protein [Anaerolineales bacterium]
MPNSIEQRIYRLPLFVRIIMGVGVIFFGFASVASYADKEEIVSFSCFIPFALVCLIGFVWSLYTIKVNDTEIAVTSFFHTNHLHWHEVSNIRFKDSGFVLINHDGDIKLSINSQVVDFLEIVDVLRSKTETLWKNKTMTDFHTSLYSLMVFAGMGLFGVLILYISMTSFIAGNDDVTTNIALLLIGLLCLGIAVIPPLKSSFEQDFLVITHLAWKRRIHISEIDGFFLEQKMIKNAFYYPVYVRLKNGKALVFNNLREGTFIFETTFQHWYEKYKST